LICQRPLPEQNGAFLLDFRIREAICPTDSQALQEAFVSKGSLEAGTGVLDKTIKNGQGAELLVYIAVLARYLSVGSLCIEMQDTLQLLSNRSGSLDWTFCLQSYDFDEVRNATHVISIILSAGHSVDLDRNGSVRLPLEREETKRQHIEDSGIR